MRGIDRIVRLARMKGGKFGRYRLAHDDRTGIP
jgi:hypothetical protein